jgi:hypothetical protein
MSKTLKITIVPFSEVPNVRQDIADNAPVIAPGEDVTQTAHTFATSRDAQVVSPANGRLRRDSGLRLPASKLKPNSGRKRNK